MLNDGTPIKIGRSARSTTARGRPATLDPATTSEVRWKLFTYAWNGATPGEHTLVSRVTDVNGTVQPTAEELETRRRSSRTTRSGHAA